MKDQNTISELGKFLTSSYCSSNESKQDKWNRALDIFIESVLKPDSALRQCAHNQKCYHELMEVRTEVLKKLDDIRWH